MKNNYQKKSERSKKIEDERLKYSPNINTDHAVFLGISQILTAVGISISIVNMIDGIFLNYNNTTYTIVFFLGAFLSCAPLEIYALVVYGAETIRSKVRRIIVNFGLIGFGLLMFGYILTHRFTGEFEYQARFFLLILIIFVLFFYNFNFIYKQIKAQIEKIPDSQKYATSVSTGAFIISIASILLSLFNR